MILYAPGLTEARKALSDQYFVGLRSAAPRRALGPQYDAGLLRVSETASLTLLRQPVRPYERLGVHPQPFIGCQEYSTLDALPDATTQEP